MPGAEGTVTAHVPMGPAAAPFCIMAAAAAAAAAAVDPGVPVAPWVKTGDAVTAGISMLWCKTRYNVYRILILNVIITIQVVDS